MTDMMGGSDVVFLIAGVVVVFVVFVVGQLLAHGGRRYVAGLLALISVLPIGSTAAPRSPGPDPTSSGPIDSPGFRMPAGPPG